MPKAVIIHTDGGSRGNPGPGAAAYVITEPSGKVIAGKGIFSKMTTNNVAEYMAVLRGLEKALALGSSLVTLRSDSELVVKQLTGQYKVKNAVLKKIYTQCLELIDKFDSVSIEHVYRESNKDADALANRSMDARADVDITPSPRESKKRSGPPLKIAVLLSGGGRTMLNIAEKIDTGDLNAKIVLVISSRSKVKGVERAKKLGLEPQIVRRKDFRDIETFSKKLHQLIKASNADLVIQAGWLCLWHIPSGYENRVMNIHPALLPSFGGQGMWGRHVHQAVIEKGCKLSGCTVHFCTNEYDKGPIVVQRCCPVEETDDPDTLADRVFEQECIAYPEAIELFAQKRIEVRQGRTYIT